MSVLRRLRELEAQATPAPWHYTGLRLLEGDRHMPSVGGYPFGREHGAAVIATTEPSYVNQPAREDAELIAAARNALPQLLAITEAVARVHAGFDCQVCNDFGYCELSTALAALDSQEAE